MKLLIKIQDLMHKMYNKIIQYAQHPHAVWILAFISFLESSCFPIPPDALLIPMMVAKPKKSFLYATVCTVASVVGGFAGYAIGMFLYDTVAEPILNYYGYMDKLQVFKNYYYQYGAWIVAAAGFTPFPYKVITILSGSLGLAIGVFSVASILSRGGRFFVLAFLLWKFGAPIQGFIDKHLGKLSILFFLLLVGGFALIKFIH
ncbi:MAG: DedA family protein [Alphaproteobacteria bacterium]|nr:DedA family protein [Alphaproteobacteria bacterium]